MWEVYIPVIVDEILFAVKARAWNEESSYLIDEEDEKKWKDSMAMWEHYGPWVDELDQEFDEF